MPNKKECLLTIIILFLIFIFTQNITQADVVVKNEGNATLFYSKNTLVARYRAKKMSNGLVEVETCHKGYCKYVIMTPMQAQTYKQNFQDRIKRITKGSEEFAARRQKEEKQYAKERTAYLQEQKAKHKKLIQEIEQYQKNLPLNLDFKVKDSCNATKNTLIIDSYAVFNAPKEKFDLIPDGALFDSNLERVWKYPYGKTFVGYADLGDSQELKSDDNYFYSCRQTNKPVFVKETISPEGNENFEPKLARFNFIKNGIYKDFAVYMDNRYALRYDVEYKRGITVDDARVWFEDYKNFLAPYLETYQKINSLIAGAKKDKSDEFRKKLVNNSLELQKKYHNKTIGEVINNKQKTSLINNPPKNIEKILTDWNITLEKMFNFKMGHYYLANGIELDPNRVDDDFLEKYDYFLADKGLIDLLKKSAQNRNEKAVQTNLAIYKQHVYRRIEDNWKYYKEGEAGEIGITFSIDENGKLLNYSISKSSGNIDHDKELIKALWYASPFEQFPTNCLEKELEFELTFSDKPKIEPRGYGIFPNE